VAGPDALPFERANESKCLTVFRKMRSKSAQFFDVFAGEGTESLGFWFNL
jgi:hypothetical protein